MEVKDDRGNVVPPINPESPGTVMPDWWMYRVAIQNAPPGTLLGVGIDDPRSYLLKIPASEVGLPENFK